MAKNLTFKLVMEADTKGFVGNMYQSEKAAKEAFAALKDGDSNGLLPATLWMAKATR